MDVIVRGWPPISHHDVSLFREYADRIYRVLPPAREGEEVQVEAIEVSIDWSVSFNQSLVPILLNWRQQCLCRYRIPGRVGFLLPGLHSYLS